MMQGAVIPFSANFGVGGSRLAWGPNGTLYVGEIRSNAYWGALSTLKPGLKRINPPADPDRSYAFEVLAVRSTGTDTLELDFTEAVASDANVTSKYVVRQWTKTPQLSYGGGNKTNISSPTVQSATVKANGKTVELRLNGLLEKYPGAHQPVHADLLHWGCNLDSPGLVQREQVRSRNGPSHRRLPATRPTSIMTPRPRSTTPRPARPSARRRRYTVSRRPPGRHLPDPCNTSAAAASAWNWLRTRPIRSPWPTWPAGK